MFIILKIQRLVEKLMAETKKKNSFNLNSLQKLNNPEILLAVAVVVVVLMVIIPLPSFILDIFMALNLTLSIIIILTTMYVNDVLEFNVFPTLLLISTIFAIALNISSTRLILLQGAAFNVQLVKAFGNFVVGGNYVVGFIIFIIIIAVQFLVITKGATRTAEVRARFMLDEMSVQSMSIDADFNAGTIDEQEKKQKQNDLKMRTSFYGNMDGAAKFVQGAVVLGIIVTVINLIGGLVTGMVIRGESFGSAIKTYALLTVGDGLVAQLPALLISTATGIIITRSATKENLGSDVVEQLVRQPRALFISSGLLFFLMFLPGFPKVALFFLSGLLGLIGYVQYTNLKQKTTSEKKVQEEKELKKRSNAANTDDLLHVDPLSLEIGYALIPLADQDSGADLIDRISSIRRNVALELGLVVPPIRIRDNLKLTPSSYSILLKGVEMAKGKLKMHYLMAMETENISEKIEGEKTIDPTFGRPALWIPESERQRAELSGYTVVDAPTIIVTHLTETVKRFGYELLGRQEVNQLLETVKKTHPVLVSEVLEQAKVSLGVVQKILQNLLREKIPIRDLVTILETIADHLAEANLDILTEFVRVALKRQIMNTFKTPNNELFVVSIDPEIEELLANSIQTIGSEFQLTLDPNVSHSIAQKISVTVNKSTSLGVNPVVLTSRNIRIVVKSLIENIDPSIIVLSYEEILPHVRVENVGIVNFRD